MGAGACHSPLGCFPQPPRMLHTVMDGESRSLDLVAPFGLPPTLAWRSTLPTCCPKLLGYLAMSLPPPPLLGMSSQCPMGLPCHPEELPKWVTE